MQVIKASHLETESRDDDGSPGNFVQVTLYR